MHDGSDYSNAIFTVQDAKALAERFVSLLLERDQLRRDIHDLRLILGELSSLRQFMTDDPAPFTATAATNGHLTTASVQADDAGERHRSDDTARDDAGDARESDADTSHTVETTPGNSREQDIAESHIGEKPADERCGETADDDANLYKPLILSDFEQADDAAAFESNIPAVVMNVTARSHPGETPERPPANTLLLKIVELFEQNHRSLSRWDVQKRLGLTRMPSAELSKLVSQGHLVRVQEGVYGVAGRHYADSIQAKG
jgi:hypothetical protein